MTFIKTPMYRRGKGNPNDGLKERALWLLSKGPMTAKQIAESLNVTSTKIKQVIRDTSRHGNCVASVKAEDVVNSDGTTDRLYTLSGKVRRVTSRVTAKKTIVISLKSLSSGGEERRRVAEEAAQRRRRLIAAGLYITESDFPT